MDFSLAFDDIPETRDSSEGCPLALYLELSSEEERISEWLREKGISRGNPEDKKDLFFACRKSKVQYKALQRIEQNSRASKESQETEPTCSSQNDSLGSSGLAVRRRIFTALPVLGSGLEIAPFDLESFQNRRRKLTYPEDKGRDCSIDSRDNSPSKQKSKNSPRTPITHSSL